MLKKELRSRLRSHQGHQEDLSSYTKTRINIPNLPSLSQEYEEQVCQLINSLTIKPCLIQFHHPNDLSDYESVRNFISLLSEQKSLWSALTGTLSWISVSFTRSGALISFDHSNLDLVILEDSLKTMSFRSDVLVSFNIQKRAEHVSIKMRLEKNKISSLSSEKENSL